MDREETGRFREKVEKPIPRDYRVFLRMPIDSQNFLKMP